MLILMDFKRLLHRQGPQPKEPLDMARDFFIKKYFISQERHKQYIYNKM